MKNKNSQHYRTIHQRVEQLLRHKAIVGIVLLFMFAAATTLDGRLRGLMQYAYADGWGWIGTYMHHEHPQHSHVILNISRSARISGPSS